MHHLSLVIPLLNEEESLPELAQWIDEVAKKHQYRYEIIFIDDGSTDSSWEVIQTIRQHNPNVKGIKFRRNYGKSAALYEGFKMAKGEVIITMDADLQDSPDEIPELVSMITKDHYHLVSGWKKVRYDNALTKNIPSKFFNGVTRKLSGIQLHDFNCGLKAYHNQVIKSIEVYGEMHRYIPVLAKSAGFNRIGEKVVQHRARKYGTSKFGWNRFVNGFLDLLTVQFIARFGKKPMHFFGLWGSVIFFVGLITSVYMMLCKVFIDDYFLSNRPPFLIALTCMIMGSMFFLSGFIAELLVRNANDRNHYLVDEVID